MLKKTKFRKIRNDFQRDYYLNEDGLMVFTEKYLLRRGKCCKSGCKHCPYTKKKSNQE